MTKTIKICIDNDINKNNVEDNLDNDIDIDNEIDYNTDKLYEKN